MALFTSSETERKIGEMSGAIQALTTSMDSLKENVTRGMSELKQELKQEIHDLRGELKEIDEKATSGSESSRENTKEISGLKVQFSEVKSEIKEIKGDIKEMHDKGLTREYMFPILAKALPWLMLMSLLGTGVMLYFIKEAIDAAS